MKRIHDTQDNIIWIAVTFLLFMFTALSTYSWGRYVFFLVCLIVTLSYAFANKGRISTRIDIYQRRFSLFVIFTGASSMWALNAQDSIVQRRTLGSMLICYFPIYSNYRDCGTLDRLYSALKWSGVFVALYTIFFFGLQNLVESAQASNLRIENEFANSNTLGVVAAISIVIQFWEIVFKKHKKVELISFIPTIVVVAASQSKKAIIVVIVGVLLVLLLKNMETRKLLNGMLKILLSFLLVVLIIVGLSKLEIFSGVIDRFISMFEIMNGAGKTGGSTWIRQKMISLGIAYWMKNPVLGVGIGCPHILAAKYLGFDAYLHNNYVELLCGGGLVGICLYYSMYVYCLIQLFKLRKIDSANSSIMIVIIMLTLITDYGMVSYYSKLTNFYLLAAFVTIERIKQEKIGERR